MLLTSLQREAFLCVEKRIVRKSGERKLNAAALARWRAKKSKEKTEVSVTEGSLESTQSRCVEYFLYVSLVCSLSSLADFFVATSCHEPCTTNSE